MNILKRFGSGSRLYTFPTDAQVSYSDNFASLVTKTVRLAGVNGGFSNLGSGRGLSPIGTVRADVWLTFTDNIDATDKVNSLRQMADWGLQPLWRKPLNGPEQFCMARITDIPKQEDVHNLPHKRMKIPVTFEVPDPFWQRVPYGAADLGIVLWDDGVTQWDGGSNWDGSAGYSIGANATWSFSNNGNAFSLARLMLTNASGNTVRNIRVQRVVDGVTEDEFYYTADLLTGTYLDVDAFRQRVAIGPVGTNALDNFVAKTPDWLRILPGSNSIKITTSGTGLLSLYLQYWERFV